MRVLWNGYRSGCKKPLIPTVATCKTPGMKIRKARSRAIRMALRIFISGDKFPVGAYLHHWLSVTIHFNRYNLCFDKYTECGDKCKSLYFKALHIRVVPPLFSPFVECPLSVSTCWMIGLFRMDVTERLLNTKIMLFLEFLRFAVGFLRSDYLGGLDSFEKV